MQKIILRGQEARDALKRGIDLVADNIKITLGPAGRNVVIGRLDMTPITSNDGAFIARATDADDPTEQMGVMMVKEATALTDINAGDGTTTTTVILQKLVETLFEKIRDNGSLVKKKTNTINLRRELEHLCAGVIKKLEERARAITKEEIYDVSIVSAEYEWLARMIADVFESVGTNGYIKIEEAKKTSCVISPGIELPVGFASEYFYTNEEKNETTLKNPYVFVTNQRLDMNVIERVFETLPPRGVEDGTTSVIFIAPDYTLDVIKRLTATRISSGFSMIPLKLPTFDKDDILIDISTLTEATFMDKNRYATGQEFIDASNFGQLGQVETAIVGESTTTLIGGNGDTSARVSELKTAYEESESEFDKNRLEERIAHLSGGFATIKIGGESDSEKTYYRLKAEDAVNAVKEALKDGVVKGGGLALKEIAEELGDAIISPALLAPYNQIQENCGGIEILDNVIDPVKITISAVKSACSLAGLIVTTEVTIAPKNESKD